jgi:3-deoxy-manno-octulosonate cytidylyltransferase (CMP-KDO synthetase)
MNPKYAVIVPARIASSRFPAKPLASIAGIPMIVRTLEQCLKTVPLEKLFLATDSSEIAQIAERYGFQSIMTSSACLTGTDRVAQAAAGMDIDVIINLQGDEPVFNPDDLQLLIDYALAHPTQIICGYAEIENENLYNSRSCPKVVMNRDSDLLYISRAPIPSSKDGKSVKAHRQVCAYAFPQNELAAFSMAAEKTPLELQEDIELLRFLEMGRSVKMLKMSTQSIPVDHAEDIAAVERFLKKQEC